MWKFEQSKCHVKITRKLSTTLRLIVRDINILIYIRSGSERVTDTNLQRGLIKPYSPSKPLAFLPSFWETLVTSITFPDGRPSWSARPSFTGVMAFSYFLSGVYFTRDEFEVYLIAGYRSGYTYICQYREIFPFISPLLFNLT